MNRTSLLVTAVAAGGIFVAGTIAGVAVVNASSSSQASAAGIPLLAQPAAGALAITEASAPPTQSPAAVPSTDATPEPTPEPAATKKPATKPSAKASTKPSSTPTPTPAAKPSSKPSSKPTNKPSTAPTPAAVSSDQATAAVLAAAHGRVIRVNSGTHDGTRAWVVMVQRTDGSTVTGYVDRQSGQVYDWVTHRRPTSSHGNDESTNGNSNGQSNGDGNGDGRPHGNDDSGHGQSGNDNNGNSGQGNGQGNRPGGNSGHQHDHDDD